jgi:hypothetical protein
VGEWSSSLSKVSFLSKESSYLAPWAIVLRTIAHGIDFSEFQRRKTTLKLAN